MEQVEFCTRFVAEIMRATARRKDEPRTYFEQYAQEVAPTYFEDKDQRAEGPERCAQSDMSYWE